jgi:Tol biopolymer transport system component
MEGYSYDPKFTPDGNQLCYRILKGGLTSYDPGELHVMELDTGHHEPLLPGLTISGGPGLAYQISPDGRQVVAVVKDREGKPRLWLAALDRQSAPRQIPGVEGIAPLFGQGGEVFFSKVDGASSYVYRVHEDGTGLRRLSEKTIMVTLGVSQDGRWVVVSLPSEIIALPVKGGLPIPIISSSAVNCHMSWSPDGRLLFISVPIAASASHVVGRTYVIPLSRGQMFPTIPPGELHSESELAKLPGVRIIEAFDGAPGPTPEVYAFSRATVQRNLYRIPIP